MVNVATIGSTTAGLDGPTTMLVSGASNVLADGLAVAYVGTPIVPHKRYGSKHTHTGAVSTGSPTIMVNGIPAAMVGTSFVTCGDMVSVSLSTTCFGGA